MDRVHKSFKRKCIKWTKLWVWNFKAKFITELVSSISNTGKVKNTLRVVRNLQFDFRKGFQLSNRNLLLVNKQ